MTTSSQKVLGQSSKQRKVIDQSIQPRQESSQQKSSKQKAIYLTHLNRFARNHAIDLIRFFFCIIFGGYIASTYFNIKPQHTSSSVLASSQILVTKGIKGVFPPLNGAQYDLKGKWGVGLINSQGDNLTLHKQYSIQFKNGNILMVTNMQCNSVIKLNWYAFSYNIYVKQIEQADSELTIQNEKQDVECLKKDTEFWQLLTNITIWTVHERRLYFISQIKEKQNKLIILQRLRK